MDGVWSVAAGADTALSSLPMVCQREKHKTGLVVELFVVVKAEGVFLFLSSDGFGPAVLISSWRALSVLRSCEWFLTNVVRNPAEHPGELRAASCTGIKTTPNLLRVSFLVGLSFGAGSSQNYSIFWQ